VRVTTSPFDVGSATGTALLEAAVAVGEPPAPAGDELWRIHGEAETVAGTRTIERWLCRHREGTLVVHASSGPAVAVDPDTNAITIGNGDTPVTLQLLTSFAIPMLLNDQGFLVLHASACVADGGAVLICGDSGSGKSSALVGLVEGGWRALTEDVCVVDLRAEIPLAWPGPPWVRRRPGEGGPAGASIRFESPDKVAWDIAPWQMSTAVPISQLVFLEHPGGTEPARQPLSQAEAVRALGGRAAWLLDPADGPRHLFADALELTRRVPAARLRLPRDASWTRHLGPLLARPPTSVSRSND
jgi:hypothetical protein